MFWQVVGCGCESGCWAPGLNFDFSFRSVGIEAAMNVILYSVHSVDGVRVLISSSLDMMAAAQHFSTMFVKASFKRPNTMSSQNARYVFARLTH
jgi:hypothetical protein